MKDTKFINLESNDKAHYLGSPHSMPKSKLSDIRNQHYKNLRPELRFGVSYQLPETFKNNHSLQLNSSSKTYLTPIQSMQRLKSNTLANSHSYSPLINLSGQDSSFQSKYLLLNSKSPKAFAKKKGPFANFSEKNSLLIALAKENKTKSVQSQEKIPFPQTCNKSIPRISNKSKISNSSHTKTEPDIQSHRKYFKDPRITLPHTPTDDRYFAKRRAEVYPKYTEEYLSKDNRFLNFFSNSIFKEKIFKNLKYSSQNKKFQYSSPNKPHSIYDDTDPYLYFEHELAFKKKVLAP